MWQGKNGPCTCFYCTNNKPHPVHKGLQGQVLGGWSTRGHLQVAESLDPRDIIRTRICTLCTHEEKI